MKTLFSLLAGLLCFCTPLTAQIVINEFQPNPADDKPEWVELYNTSDLPVENLSLLLHDTRSGIRLEHLTFLPHGYAVICADTSQLKYYHSLPESCTLIEAKLPTLNNSTDVIVIRNMTDSSMLDSVYFNVKWVKKGVSFERKLIEYPAYYPLNLGASSSKDSATCGYINSISPREIDLSLRTFTFFPLDGTLTAIAVNSGRTTISTGELTLYFDKNHNSLADEDERAESIQVDNLKPGDSLALTTSMSSLSDQFQIVGDIQCLAVCATQGDGLPSNDTLNAQAYISFPRGSILINEILYEPLSGAAEFIELYNNSDTPIDLNGWKIHDKPSSSGADTLHLLSRTAMPGEYIVIAWDSVFLQQYPAVAGDESVQIIKSSLSLNSDGDAIVLLDKNGLQIDSLMYSPSWHDRSLSIRKGVSLEKISPAFPSNLLSSWSSCGNMITRATPGENNSLNVLSHTSEYLSASPNPFSPSSLSAPFTQIRFQLDAANCVVTASIYNTYGALVTRLLNTIYSSSQGAVIWNGKDSAGNSLPPGGYVVVLEYTHTQTGVVKQHKLLLVLGGA